MANISHLPGWGTAEHLLLGPAGKDLLLQLEDETLKLVEPHSQALLHAQPIVSIRVWGASGGTAERWEQGWGSGVGGSASSPGRGPPPNSVVCLSCAAGPRERYYA